jgi:hypothetical protein
VRVVRHILNITLAALGAGVGGVTFCHFPFLSVGVILVYANVVIKSSERGGGICFSKFWVSPRSGVLGFHGFDFYGFPAQK